MMSEKLGARRNVTRQVLGLVAIALALVSCSNDSTSPKADPAPTTITTLPRALTATETQIRDAANNFSFALMSSVNAAHSTDNVFLSPLSASLALGMTMNGADGTTQTEMRSALQFGSVSQHDINANYQSLMALLLSLDATTKLTIANSIWYRQGVPFRQSFFDTTSRYFGATVKPLNFADKTASLSAINGWANTATNGLIPTVLEDIKPAAVMYLMNAIYFKGVWRDQFDAANTVTSTFTSASGVKQGVRLMHNSMERGYAETALYQAVDLPYGNSAFSMTVVLPKVGVDVNTLLSTFNSASLDSLATRLKGMGLISLWLPKIKLAQEAQLNAPLDALGMHAAFTGAADFSALAPAELGVYVDFVKQNAYVDINEEGTEAAAVTSVGAVATSAPIEQTMRVDRPYLFIIRERLTGTVLFVGKIVKMPG